MVEYDNGDRECWHPHLTHRETMITWGINLIDGKYIQRLSEKGELYLELVLEDGDVYDEVLRETADGKQYYESLCYEKYYYESGERVPFWVHRYSIFKYSTQYYDKAGNKLEILLEPIVEEEEEEDDFNWMYHEGQIEIIEIEGLLDIRVGARRGFSGH